jgi:hypothetical protein
MEKSKEALIRFIGNAALQGSWLGSDLDAVLAKRDQAVKEDAYKEVLERLTRRGLEPDRSVVVKEINKLIEA